jgi:Mn2+/Fe2+ NRAMP family transporter
MLSPVVQLQPDPNWSIGGYHSQCDFPRSVSWLRKALKIFGPGLVTGAADDDPIGIATYSSVGAQFGYSMLWTMPLIYPFMAAIQEISARLGRVTGRGIAGNMRRFYPAWMLYGIIAFLLIANIINLAMSP